MSGNDEDDTFENSIIIDSRIEYERNEESTIQEQSVGRNIIEKSSVLDKTNKETIIKEIF